MAGRRWTKSDFTVKMITGASETRHGWICDYFGIDYREGKGWALTHLPSGRLINYRPTKASVKALVGCLIALHGDWSSSDTSIYKTPAIMQYINLEGAQDEAGDAKRDQGGVCHSSTGCACKD